jgi:hypothetical protein
MNPIHEQIVTANRLADGAVVYLTAQGDWSESIKDGHIALGKYESRDLMAWAGRSVDRDEVVGPYLMAIDAADRENRPLGMRETIRAGGPTVETGR